MRVLFISTDFPFETNEGALTQGGGGACIAQLAEGMSDRGHDIEVVTRAEPDFTGELFDFPIHRTSFADMGFRESKITHYFSANKKCKQLLRDKKFDIIHSHNPLAGLTGTKVAKDNHIMIFFDMLFPRGKRRCPPLNKKKK